MDLTSKCAEADWTEQTKFFQTLPNLNNLAFSNCSENVQNVIQMALKWLFFSEKLQELPGPHKGIVILHAVFTTNNFQNRYYKVF